jgi:hypothetical protein
MVSLFIRGQDEVSEIMLAYWCTYLKGVDDVPPLRYSPDESDLSEWTEGETDHWQLFRSEA